MMWDCITWIKIKCRLALTLCIGHKGLVAVPGWEHETAMRWQKRHRTRLAADSASENPGEARRNRYGTSPSPRNDLILPRQRAGVRDREKT